MNRSLYISGDFRREAYTDYKGYCEGDVFEYIGEAHHIKRKERYILGNYSGIWGMQRLKDPADVFECFFKEGHYLAFTEKNWRKVVE